ncbi:synaptopodin 2-like protein [Chanos chanos]|uniref:Synaptopodin 2-like protein n=1 Tax=Chanos chanos TaxID=29144 RepID=A0A6J2V6Y6_CHACN|nr:synaptopodin 2-like protein [Chanos chanos]
MVAEEVIISLSGGAPWGFRLQGGVEQQKPLQVAKVRKRSKACRAGLREGDELVSINESPCAGLSHAQAMNLIDSIPGTLHIRIKRAPTGFQSVVLMERAPSPRIDKEYRAALRAMTPAGSRTQQPAVRQVHRGSVISPAGHSGLTSPPGSEAYYGETDSDADVAAHERQRRQKRRSPSNSGNPGKTGRVSPEGGETSEMSGYDSAPDVQAYPLMETLGRGDTLPGVARKEVIYQPPPPGAWSSQTSTETSSMSADDQNPREGAPEEDSGFQDLTNVPPLVSPERAKEALMLSSQIQLVPMVGPVDTPVDEELTMTYMDKAKQAKLNRGESVQDKQVREARTKCRTIASLLTDAPNPHSKGVLMFKKRRQRSKKYTLTSFGSVDEDMRQDSQEEDGVFPGSESEFDEDGFSAAPDPTWDSDYLDVLERRSASVNRVVEGEGADDAPSPGLSDTAGKGAQLFEQQRRRAAEHAKKVAASQAQLQSPTQTQPQTETQTQPPLEPNNQMPVLTQQPEIQTKPSIQPPPVAPKPVRTTEAQQQQEAKTTEMPVTIAPQAVTPSISAMTNGHATTAELSISDVIPIATGMVPSIETVMPTPPAPLPELPPSSVLNRTAQPFAPGFITNRAATAPVVFRPSVAKKTPRPVSVAVVALPFSAASEERAIAVAPASSAPSVAVSQVNASEPVADHTMTSVVSTGPLSPPSSMAVATHALPPHFPSMENIQAATVVPPAAIHTPAITSESVLVITAVTPAPSAITTAPNPLAPVIPHTPVAPTVPGPPVTHVSAGESHENIHGRTGILLEARRRNAYRPMFRVPDNNKNSPNPELLSMVQNLDERPRHSYPEPTVPMTGTVDDYSRDADYSQRGKVPPPVAPKPRVIPEVTHIPQAEGKGAELFARRQRRMDLYVVDSPPSSFQQPIPQPQPTVAMNQQQDDFLSSSSLPSNWKYSPNIRAPPPIGYNPLLSPSCPLGVQRGGAKGSDGSTTGARSGYGTQKEGIKAIDFMRRQPYQLNPAMFSFGGGSNVQSSTPFYQRQQQEGYTLTPPKQIPVKAARVYEIKRFSTPTPMSASPINPTVIAPRSQTTLGEPLCRSDMTSPPLVPTSPPPPPSAPIPARAPGLPELPKISAAPVVHPLPYSPPAPMSSMSSLSYPGLQAAKQFKSAPELSALPPNPLRVAPVQAPKPRFIATRVGIQPRVWRPGTLHH